MAEHLDELRKAARESDLSLYRIAKLCDLKCNTVSDFVRRGRNVRPDTAAKIADVLGVEFRLHHRQADRLGVGHAATSAGNPGGA